jgi:hypothetical protein
MTANFAAAQRAYDRQEPPEGRTAEDFEAELDELTAAGAEYDWQAPRALREALAEAPEELYILFKGAVCTGKYEAAVQALLGHARDYWRGIARDMAQR